MPSFCSIKAAWPSCCSYCQLANMAHNTIALANLHIDIVDACYFRSFFFIILAWVLSPASLYHMIIGQLASQSLGQIARH